MACNRTLPDEVNDRPHATASLVADAVADPYGLPKLHEIHEAIIVPGCGSTRPDRDQSSLFLSKFSKDFNMPELLSGCVSTDDRLDVTPELQAASGYSMIGDLGPVPLENVTAQRAFNFDNTSGRDTFFHKYVRAKLHHTYAVLVSGSDTVEGSPNVQALFVVRVVALAADEIRLQYAVLGYSIVKPLTSSAGFSWEQRNGTK